MSAGLTCFNAGLEFQGILISSGGNVNVALVIYLLF